MATAVPGGPERQPVPHPWRRGSQVKHRSKLATLPELDDDHGRDARALPADGAAGRLVRAAVRRADRAAPRRRATPRRHPAVRRGVVRAAGEVHRRRRPRATPASATWPSRRTWCRGRASTWRGTSSPARMGCCSRRARAGTWRRRPVQGLLPGPRGGRAARPPVPRPAAHRGGAGRGDGRNAGRADGAASGTPRQAPRCATSTPRRTVMRR